MPLGSDLAGYQKRFLDVLGGITGISGTPFEKRAPVVLDRGEGCHVWDVDGSKYVDYTCGGGPLQLGYAHPTVVEAIEEGLANPPGFEAEQDDLQKIVLGLFKSMDSIRLVGSESEAVHAAIRLARAFTGKTKIVKFEGHYHGWFDNVAWDSNHFHDEMGSREEPILHPLSQGQCGESIGDLILLPWNDLEAVERVFEKQAKEIACVISEPVIPYAGIPPIEGFFSNLETLCAEQEVLFVLDERLTGFRWAVGGAQSAYHCHPDLTTLSHVMDGGLAMGAVGGRDDILRDWDRLFPEILTESPDIIALVAGKATMGTLFRDDAALLKHSWQMTDRLAEGVRKIGNRSSLPFSVRKFPCCFHSYFPMVDPESIVDARSYSQTRVDWIFDLVLKLEDRGILISPSGGWAVTSVHQVEDIDLTLTKFEDALRALESSISAM